MTRCYMCLSNFVSTKILVSLTLARSRAHCRKQNSDDFLQHTQPPTSKNSPHQSSKSKSPTAALFRSGSRCYYDSSLAASLRRNIHGPPNYGKRTHREMSFFKKYSVTLDLANNIVRFPDITLQLRPVNVKFKNKLPELKTTQKMTYQPNQQVDVPVVNERDLGDITGTVEGLPAFERRSHLLVSPALSETRECRTHVQITNPLDYQITINVGTAVASFKIMTPKQANNLQPMTSHQLNLIT